MWIDAYNWDRTTNNFHIHHKLSEEQIFSKQRTQNAHQISIDALYYEISLEQKENKRSDLFYK